MLVIIETGWQIYGGSLHSTLLHAKISHKLKEDYT